MKPYSGSWFKINLSKPPIIMTQTLLKSPLRLALSTAAFALATGLAQAHPGPAFLGRRQLSQTPQASQHPAPDRRHETPDVSIRRFAVFAELRSPAARLARIHAIQPQHMKVKIDEPSLAIPVVRDSPSTTGSIRGTDRR